MYRISEGYLIASLICAKIKYLNEYYVNYIELEGFKEILYQKALELNLDILIMSDYELEKYFMYIERTSNYILNDGIEPDDLKRRFCGYLPLKALELLWNERNIKEVLIELKRKEIMIREEELQMKKQILARLELNAKKIKNKSR